MIADLDISDREQRESRAFDRYVGAEPFPCEKLIIPSREIERYRHAFRVKRYPIDMLFRITGDVRGMRVLDIGCGTGVWSSILALLGASVIGADVSEAELKIATERAAANGITSRLALTLASVHSLPFESGSFDLVFGNAILHHVDLSRAGAETARVLRSGGRAVFREPVALSATLRRLRKSIIVARLVKDSRISPDEEPLTRGQIEEFGDLFSDHRVHEMQMLARFDRIFRTPRVIKMLNEVDLRLFDFFPPLRRFARQAIVEFVK